MDGAAIKQEVLRMLQISSRPLDDDELARRLSVSPRQTINQVCRKLEADGLVSRRTGPDGKIVNELAVIPTGVDEATPVRSPALSIETSELPAGYAREQQLAEKQMIELLGRHLGLVLAPRRIVRPGGVRIEVDAADEGLTVLAEAWAHQGSPKAAQKHKVLADALKLVWIGQTLPAEPRRIMCFSDPLAAQHFSGSRSWAAAAFTDLGVEVVVVPLSPDVRAAIRAAQERQYR